MEGIKNDIRYYRKRNGLIILVVSSILLLVCIGCNAQKRVSRTEYLDKGSEQIEQRADSTYTEQSIIYRGSREGVELENIYTRVTDYDIEGAIQRISETWRDRLFFDVDSEERSERNISVTEADEQIVIRDTAQVRIKENENIKTDSRLVQGVDWFWIMLSAFLIATVIIYIIYNRVK